MPYPFIKNIPIPNSKESNDDENEQRKKHNKNIRKKSLQITIQVINVWGL